MVGSEFGAKQHESMDQICPVSTLQAGGGGVMMWGMFFWHALGPSISINDSLNATAHLSIVADHVRPFMAQSTHLLMATSSMIMHHVKKAKVISNWFHEHDILLEHLWDVVEWEICSMNVQLTNLQKLCDAIMSTWDRISKECFNVLKGIL